MNITHCSSSKHKLNSIRLLTAVLFIRIVFTIIVTIAHKSLRNAALVGTFKLAIIARWIFYKETH